MTLIIPDLAAADYHANKQWTDPPASSSIIKLLLEKSPAHVWAQHPSLNPDWQPDDGEKKFDVGTYAHSIFLEGDQSRVHVVDATEWRTNAAKEERDAARAEGKVPLLAHQYEEVRRMVDALRAQIAYLDAQPPVFVNGRPEQTIVWREEDVLCKMRADYLHNSHCVIDDLKTTAGSAAPEKVERHLFSMGYDVQAAFYLRGLRALNPDAAKLSFRFVFVESRPPYAAACYELSPAALALGDQKVRFALELWRNCLAQNRWPAYPAQVMTVDPPAWEEVRFYDREERNAA